MDLNVLADSKAKFVQVCDTLSIIDNNDGS